MSAYKPRAAEQKIARAVATQILKTELDPLARSSEGFHFTASTVLLREHDGAVLLTLHHRYKKWLQLGGHIEAEDLGVAHAALREAHEESGISDISVDPDIIDIDLHPAACPEPGSWHVDLRFLALAPPWAEPVATDESEQVAWFPPGQEPENLDPRVKRAITKARAKWAQHQKDPRLQPRLLRSPHAVAVTTATRTLH